ncbi:MAG: hypothetical protein E7329_07295 [Clostridiales bacterium]|nr:hypothetical protein [Clostridiales bacterium]
MRKGIAIVGLNGAGKSTLAHALAQATGYFEMDVEDYYFPEQRVERRRALEGSEVAPNMASPSFSQSKTKEEVEEAMLEDIHAHPCFILSGVKMQWNDEISSRIQVAFWVRVSRKARLQRIRERSEKRFGARVLPGGDMYAQEEAFRAMAAGRDERMVGESLKKLSCPVIILDGTLPITKNVKIMIDTIIENPEALVSGADR